MSDIYDELGEVLNRHRTEHEQRTRQEAEDARFAELNTKIDTLAESVTKLVSSAPSVPPEGSGGAGDPPSDGGSGDPPPDPNPAPEPDPELPVERVTKLGVPRIHQGDDEPSTVSYIDPDTGETKTRPGRQKGKPYGYSIEPVELEPPQEGEPNV